MADSSVCGVGDWKAIRRNLHPGPKAKNPQPAAIELYNLAGDPGETRNVAAQHPDVVSRLSAILKDQHIPSKLFPLAVLDRP